LVIDTGIDTGLCFKSKSCSGLAAFLNGFDCGQQNMEKNLFQE
jgi:hypothetical protein